MKNKIITLVLVLTLLIGIGLILYNPIQSFLVSRLSSQLVSADVPTNISEKHVDFDFDAVQTLSLADILKAQSNQSDLPIIGAMTIPAVDLQLPILKGVAKEALATGAGTMKPDQVLGEGNYALASHYFENSDILFGPLYKTKEGDSIYLSDQTHIYEYKISMIKVIKATDVYIIDDVDNATLLTLITCAEDGQKRLAVQADYVGKEPLE